MNLAFKSIKLSINCNARLATVLRLGQSLEMDDPAQGGLTPFWELFTVIPCALKNFKC